MAPAEAAILLKSQIPGVAESTATGRSCADERNAVPSRYAGAAPHTERQHDGVQHSPRPASMSQAGQTAIKANLA